MRKPSCECGECTKCKNRIYQRDWASKNKERMKGYNNKESRRRANRKTTAGRYGLTHEQYEGMHEAQGGVCKICKKPETCKGNNGEIKMLAIDHSHETGEVRGLLCNNCNRAIGLLGDDVDTLLNAVEYLRFKY
jgi:hypothetical protein